MSALQPIWIHGSSLGDVNALRALSAQLHERGHPLTLSASTASGRTRWEMLIDQAFFSNAESVRLSAPPLLSPLHVERSLRESRAQFLILELLELWPPWVSRWAKRGVKIIVVDGRVSARTMWARPLLSRSFASLSLFLAQSELDAERAIKMGCDPAKVKVCGDAKIDSILHSLAKSDVPADAPQKFELILGCVRPRDEASLVAGLTAYQTSRPDDRVLIAPRHLQRVHPLLKRLRRAGINVQLYSELTSLTDSSPGSIILLDQYGELATLYHHTHCAIIGGTFFDRGQNLIEAAYAGCGLIYGPLLQSQRAHAAAITNGGGGQVDSWLSAFQLAARWQSERRHELSVDRDALRRLQGSIERQLHEIDHLIFG